MDVRETIRGRRSIRRFLEKPIPEDSLEALSEALIWAPSAGNLQARKFYFVTNADLKKRIATLSLGQRFISTAPLVIVACADLRRISRYGVRGERLYAIQDVAVALENLMLQAYALGLGSAWVGAFDDDGISLLLELAPHLRPMAVVPVGYPAQSPSAPQRSPKEELIAYLR